MKRLYRLALNSSSRSMTRWLSLMRTTLRRGCCSVGTSCAVTFAGCKSAQREMGSECQHSRRSASGQANATTHKVEPVEDALDDAGGKGLARERAHVLWDRDVLRQYRAVERDHVWHVDTSARRVALVSWEAQQGRAAVSCATHTRRPRQTTFRASLLAGRTLRGRPACG